MLDDPCSFAKTLNRLTSILDTVLRQDAVAPIAHTAHNLCTTAPVRRWVVCNGVVLLLREPLPVPAVEPLLEVRAHLVPALAVRVTHDGLVR